LDGKKIKVVISSRAFLLEIKMGSFPLSGEVERDGILTLEFEGDGILDAHQLAQVVIP